MDESSVDVRLARRIKRRRLKIIVNEKPMTQQEFGRRARLPMQRISEIERCKRAVQLNERGRIARALETTERELFADLGYSEEAVAVTGEAHARPMGGGTAEIVSAQRPGSASAPAATTAESGER
jgi:transcriptional regulator with XRE-family HTH domain